MTRTFTSVRFERKRYCQSCGNEADHLFMADTHEPGTGYVDEVAMCDTCLLRREEAQMKLERLR